LAKGGDRRTPPFFPFFFTSPMSTPPSFSFFSLERRRNRACKRVNRRHAAISFFFFLSGSPLFFFLQGGRRERNSPLFFFFFYVPSGLSPFPFSFRSPGSEGKSRVQKKPRTDVISLFFSVGRISNPVLLFFFPSSPLSLFFNKEKVLVLREIFGKRFLPTLFLPFFPHRHVQEVKQSPSVLVPFFFFVTLLFFFLFFLFFFLPACVNDGMEVGGVCVIHLLIVIL